MSINEKLEILNHDQIENIC